MTGDHNPHDGCCRGRPTSRVGSVDMLPERLALGEELARVIRVSARYAASVVSGFWSERWETHPPADHRPADHRLGHADVLDRVAAFTDDMTEMLAADRRFPYPRRCRTPPAATSAPPHHVEAESSALFADCEKALRAVAGMRGVPPPLPADGPAHRAAMLFQRYEGVESVVAPR